MSRRAHMVLGMALLIAGVLIAACQPVQPLTEAVVQAAPDPQLGTTAELLFEQDVTLVDENVDVKIRRVVFPVGFKTPEHTHAGPGPRYVVQGAVEVIEAGETNTFTAGEVFWETGVIMTSENVGDEELVLIIVELLPPEEKTAAAHDHADHPPATDEEKIASAMSSAPLSVSADARIVDWPAAPGEEPRVLREGDNGWVCRPDNPASPHPDPRCLDENWRNIFGMPFGPEREAFTGIGTAYMLAGDSVADNDDPTVTEPPEGQEWQANVPHLMIATPGRLDPDRYTNDRLSGGPWIMFGGTPAEHLMIPIVEPVE